MKKLDRNRPFGTIYPAHHGALYEQDGVLFGADERQIGPSQAPVTAPAKRTAPRKEPTPAANPQLAAQLADD